MFGYNSHKKYAGIVIAVIVLFGGLLRFWQLGYQSLWIDEGFTINGALSIDKTGFPVLDSGKFYYNSILYSYIVAATNSFVKFDPHNPWPARIPAAIFGTVVILFAYFLYKELFKSRWGAILVAFLIAFSYWEIAWSRQIRGYSAVALFSLVTLLFLWRYAEKKKLKDLLISASSVLVGCLFHPVALAFIPSFLMIIFLFRGNPDKDRRIFYKNLLFILGIFFALLIIFKYLFPEIYNQSQLSLFFSLPLYLVILFAGLFAGFILTLCKFERATFFLFFWLFISSIVICSYSYANQVRYFLPLVAPMSILFVRVLQNISEILFFGISDKIKHFILLMLSFIIFYPFLSFSLNTYYALETGSPQPDFASAYRTINNYKNSNSIIVSGYTPMNLIYFGQKGFWLKMNLNGPIDSLERKIVNGLDYYTAAPVINNSPDLFNLLRSSHGFIVIDKMTRDRLPYIYNVLVRSHDVKKIFESENKNPKNLIQVFAF